MAGHTSFINRLAISEDDQTLISASVDKTILLWDMNTTTRETVLDSHTNHVNTLG
ncbi:MAG: hypothetical protein HC929_11420 [Leptolyngbyaceae cyanobacterium SM2_5_2]|nr:hypothetical protein [Leptolyngbyaceae cyanobacterium SM2_5_2]